MKGFLAALQFLTIFPVSLSFQEQDLAQAPNYFPVVGFFLGLLLALIHWSLSTYLSTFLVSAVIVIAHIVLTSGLHLDGFMDTIDGMVSGKETEAMLLIFKDTHTGAKSVIALFALLLLKTALIAEMMGPSLGPILITMAVSGRWSLVWSIGKFPYIRERGLGTSYQERIGFYQPWLHTGLVALLNLLLLSWVGFLAFGALVLLIHWVALSFSKRFGGLVGDFYGALCEGGEVAFLGLVTIAFRLGL